MTLIRSSGRFHVRPPHYAKDSCRLIRSAKLSSPAWGGTTNRRLGIAVRLVRKGSVTITVRKGKKVVKRFRIKQAGTRTRPRLPQAGHPAARRLPRDDRGASRVAHPARGADVAEAVAIGAR